MKKISQAFVVVENSPESADKMESFCRQCEGLKVKFVSFVTDNKNHVQYLKKLAAKFDGSYPEKVVCLMAKEVG